MRILFSVNHPAHVHLFKNTIRAFEKKGYKIKIVAKNKEITHQLLNELNLKYEQIGKVQGNLIKKGLDMLASYWRVTGQGISCNCRWRVAMEEVVNAARRKFRFSQQLKLGFEAVGISQGLGK